MVHPQGMHNSSDMAQGPLLSDQPYKRRYDSPHIELGAQLTVEKTPNQRPAVRISDHESATTDQRPKNENQRPIFANQRPHVNQRPQSSESAITILRISDHMWESATTNQRPHARNSLCTRSGYLQPAIHGRKLETKPRRRSEMEKVRREKMQVREEVGKSRNTVFSNVLWLRRVEK